MERVAAMGRLRPLLLAPVVLGCTLAHAGRPLSSETADVLEDGANEVEVYAARVTASGSPDLTGWSTQYARGIGWGTQLKAFLRRLTSQIGVAAEVRDAISGDEPLARTHLDEFIRRLRAFNAEVGRGCQDTARALVLLGAQDFEAQDVGYAYLISEPGDPDRRAAWGVSPAIHDPELVVRDVSRLMALTLSPTVIAMMNQTMTLICRRRYAMAPSSMAWATRFIASLPASARRTFQTR